MEMPLFKADPHGPDTEGFFFSFCGFFIDESQYMMGMQRFGGGPELVCIKTCAICRGACQYSFYTACEPFFVLYGGDRGKQIGRASCRERV